VLHDVNEATMSRRDVRIAAKRRFAASLEETLRPQLDWSGQ
jgi:hypothetical protein